MNTSTADILAEMKFADSIDSTGKVHRDNFLKLLKALELAIEAMDFIKDFMVGAFVVGVFIAFLALFVWTLFFHIYVLVALIFAPGIAVLGAVIRNPNTFDN